MKAERIVKFEKYLNELNEESVRDLAMGLCYFTEFCINNGFKAQRNATIDFALTARNEYIDRVIKRAKEQKELPY